jgi:hypothetical protein
VIILLSNSAALRKAVKDALAPTKVTARKITPKQAARAKADAVVTTTALTSQVSWLAMRLMTPLIFVLPEAAAALNDYVASRPDAVLAGNDLQKIDSLVRAETKAGEQEVLL